MSTGNPYYDSMRKNDTNTTILPQQTNEEMNRRVIAGAALMSKDILENTKMYLQSLLNTVNDEGKAYVDKETLGTIILNIETHLKQCY